MTALRHIGINIFIAVLFMVLAIDTSIAQDNTVNKTISISFSGSTLDEALNRLTAEHHVLFSFDPSLLPTSKKINKTFTSTPVFTILDFLFTDVGLTYKLVGKTIVVLPIKPKLNTINGRIRDAQTGEDLIGANIHILPIKQGINSNNYGYYSITLPPGNYELFVSHVGYKTRQYPLSLYRSKNLLDIELEKQENELNEVIVNYNMTNDSTALQNPGQTLEVDEMKKLPYYKGEIDVIKALQMQNGIVSLSEGSSNMFVKGGNRDQNLILLDEAIVYNPAHLFGLTSIFNPDALKNIQVYSNGMPANFGGRLSSVLDARMADGDDKNFHVKGGISLLAARIAVEGPVVKEQGSFLFAARRSLYNLLNKNLDLFNVHASYYDLNFKINYKLGTSDRVYFSTYIGNDDLNSSNNYLNSWGNQTATLRWNHIFNSKLFMNISAIYSNYKNQLDIDSDVPTYKSKWITGIKDFTIKGDLTLYNRPNSQLQFGSSNIFHLFMPGESSDVYTLGDVPRARASEHALYISHRVSVGEKIRLTYGIRGNLFRTLSTPLIFQIDENDNVISRKYDLEGKYKTFVGLEPRFMIQYAIKPLSQLQLMYNRNYQYLQLVQNDELAFSSLESWIPSSFNIQPQRSDVFSLEFRNKLRNWTLSVGTYYKMMENQLELIDHAQIILNPFIEDKLRAGSSHAYGAEMMISKDKGKLTGSLSYTWSRVFRKIDQVNRSQAYPASFDIPHVAKLAIGYQIFPSISVNSFFTYSSGRPITPIIGYFINQGMKVPIFSDRNSSRMPDYHRLDVNIQWESKSKNSSKRHWANTLSVGLYNVYGKKNPLFYGIVQDITTDNLTEAQAFSGVVPMVNYTFKF